MFPQTLAVLAESLLVACRAEGLTLGLAESCTGGLIGGLVTSVPGSSAVFDRGFVTYTNLAKSEMLGVPVSILKDHGAVSEACALAMAEGVLIHSQATLSAAVTGIAGPGGGTSDKPVGLVHIAVARKGFPSQHDRHIFKGDRHHVRLQATESAIVLLTRMAAT